MIKHLLLLISFFILSCSGSMIIEPSNELLNKIERWELMLQEGLIDKEEFDSLIRSGKRTEKMRNLIISGGTSWVRLQGNCVIGAGFRYCYTEETVRFDGRPNKEFD